nr:hypothetical protein CFP56_00096 [Quercus suber]
MKKANHGKDGSRKEKNGLAPPHQAESSTMPEKEPTAENCYNLRINSQSRRNGHTDLHPINDAIPPFPHAYNSVINELPGELNMIEKSTTIATDQLVDECVNEVPGKEKNNVVESMTREGINCGDPIEGKKLNNSCEPTRVPDHAKRVLPSWTRRCRPVTQSQVNSIGKITGKKREHVTSDDHVEVFSKRLQISQNEFENSKVDILIDPSSRQWNEEMLYGLFNTEAQS